MAWRDATDDDKRPLRMSEVVSEDRFRPTPLLPSVFSVLALIAVLGASATGAFFIYDHHKTLATLSERFNNTKDTASTSPTGDRLAQALASIKSMEVHISALDRKISGLETTLSSQNEQLKELKSMLKEAERKKSNAEGNP